MHWDPLISAYPCIPPSWTPWTWSWALTLWPSSTDSSSAKNLRCLITSCDFPTWFSILASMKVHFSLVASYFPSNHSPTLTCWWMNATQDLMFSMSSSWWTWSWPAACTSCWWPGCCKCTRYSLVVDDTGQEDDVVASTASGSHGLRARSSC